MNIKVFTNSILKFVCIFIENIFRLLGLIFISDELLSLCISDRKGILKDVFTGVYLGSTKEFFEGLLILIIFVLLFVWVLQPLISIILTRIFKVNNIKELKKINVSLQIIRIIAIILFITLGSVFVGKFYTKMKNECGFSNIFEVVKEIQVPTYKTDNETIIMKTKYNSGRTMYILKIKKSYIQKYSPSLKVSILFMDSEGFLIHRESIPTPIKNFNLIDGYYEHVGAFVSTKKDYKNINRVNWEYKN